MVLGMCAIHIMCMSIIEQESLIALFAKAIHLRFFTQQMKNCKKIVGTNFFFKYFCWDKNKKFF